VPVFFVVVRSIFKGSPRQREVHKASGEHLGIQSHE